MSSNSVYISQADFENHYESRKRFASPESFMIIEITRGPIQMQS